MAGEDTKQLFVMTQNHQLQRHLSQLLQEFYPWGVVVSEPSLVALLEGLQNATPTALILDDSAGSELLAEGISCAKGLVPSLPIAVVAVEQVPEIELRRVGARIVLSWPQDREQLDDWLRHLFSPGDQGGTSKRAGQDESGATWLRMGVSASASWRPSNFPCRAACPVGTNAGGYSSLVAQGRYREAYALARRPNPLASVCGWICAHPCEVACRRDRLDQPIAIRALKRFVTERCGPESGRDFDEILSIVEIPRPRIAGGKVAIIGAGPAGLAAAHDLALMGHTVVIFDRALLAGGMLRAGIPRYRLPRETLDLEVEFIRYLGVEFRMGVEIGSEVSFQELRQEYDAVFLAPGCGTGRNLSIPGSELEGVINAVSFLAHVNLGHPIAIGQEVVVIGGGNVAYDVARSAQLLFVADGESGRLALDSARIAARSLRRKVTMVALEAPSEMLADPTEIREAAEEGVRLVTRRGPAEIQGEGGRVSGLVTLQVERVFDQKGKFSPILTPGTEQIIQADTVIIAIGQVADLRFLGEEHGLEITPRWTVKVEPKTLATSDPRVFAGGDVVWGPRIAIDAIADGRKAARSIDTLITGRGDEAKELVYRTFPTDGYSHPFAVGDYEKIPRHRVPIRAPDARALRQPVELGYGEEQAREEGSRCLHCWINTIFYSTAVNGSECIQCGGCVDVCPEDCIDLISLVRVAGEEDGNRRLLPDGTEFTISGAAMIKDETSCIRCGLCARRCPAEVISMEAFYQKDELPWIQHADISV